MEQCPWGFFVRGHLAHVHRLPASVMQRRYPEAILRGERSAHVCQRVCGLIVGGSRPRALARAQPKHLVRGAPAHYPVASCCELLLQSRIGRSSRAVPRENPLPYGNSRA
jgi:hypothetical protein